VGNFITKVLLDCLRIGEGVFDDIVQESGRNGDVIEAHVGENVGHFERMDEVGFA
jgi:hypothetical protein